MTKHTKSSGVIQKTAEDFINEVHNLLGKNFPITVKISNGIIVEVTYEDSWYEGKLGEKLKNIKLSDVEKTKLNSYLASNGLS